MAEIKNKDPAFLFYPSDFLTGTYMMSYTQKGKYITLLCLQQQQGHLSKEIIYGICGKDETLIKKFLIDEKGLYYNARLESEMRKRAEYSEKQRENANKRWNKTDTDAMPPHCNGIANAMPLENVNVNINKDINNKSKKGVKGEKRDLFKDYSNGNEELYNALLGFEEMRNKIKKPMTDRAKVLLLKDLDGLTSDEAVKVKILDRSTQMCWQGVFQLDETKDKPKNDLKGNKGFIQRKYSKEQLDALYDDIEEFDV